MNAILSAISGVGAVVTLAFLVRALIRRPRLVATAKYPSYMRMSLNLSHLVCASVIVPWGFAAFNANDFVFWLSLMVSPLIFGLVFVAYAKKMMDRQSPEIQEYARDLAKDSRTVRFAERNINR